MTVRPEIIAELSCNHGGRLERALELVDAAKDAGADGIKIQCWDPNRMVTAPYFLPDGPWAGRNLSDLYREAHTPWSWIPAIFDRAKQQNLAYIASVFDENALRYLEDIGCPRYKIASFELVDTPLIEAVAETGKPIILSTGMAEGIEIWRAVKAAGKYASPPRDITVLHCVSAYPAPPAAMNLQAIPAMRGLYEVPVGLSDHSRGTTVAVAAAALGAVMIEKHFILDARLNGTLDAAFSIEPHELRQLVQDIQIAWEATHTGASRPAEEDPQRRLRRSLYWTRDVEPGRPIARADLTTARPDLGDPPSILHQLIGRRLAVTAKAKTPVKMTDLTFIKDPS